MKKLCLLSLALLLVGLAGASALAEEQTKTVTLEGMVMCATCTLHSEGQDECQNILVVERKGKEKVFYLVKNDVYAEFGDVCRATKQIRVTGQVKKEGDRRLLEPTEITELEDES